MNLAPPERIFFWQNRIEFWQKEIAGLPLKNDPGTPMAARAATYFSFVVLMSFLVSLRESLRDPTASEAANCAICTAKQTDKSK